MALVVAAWLGVSRRAPEPAGRRGSLALAAAVLLLGVSWVRPLATLAQHYLLALPRDAGIPARSIPLPLRLAVHPIVAIIAVNAGFIVWHVTPAYDAALAHSWLYDLMQTTLLLVSLLFWWPIVTPCSPPGRALR